MPIRQDGTKKPIGQWLRYMDERADVGQMSEWFENDHQQGMAIICGKVSGNLEMLELEGRAADAEHLDKVVAACREAGILWLWDTLTSDGYAEWTPSGGIHLLYRITDHEVPGNTKVASRPKTEDELTESELKVRAAKPDAFFMTTLAETRGEGGYVIVAPSGGTVHPSGDSWTVVAGEIGKIPSISWDDRCLLHAAITKALDIPAPRAVLPPKPALPKLASGAKRPGDDFNERGSWDFFERAGWSILEVKGSTTYWVKPGSNPRDGHHATTGHSPDGDRLYVFSTATQFPAETPITKFAAYTELEHAGNWSAATKALAAEGYGEQLAPRVAPVTLGNYVPTFHEPDEPVAQVQAAFDAGVHGVTAPPAPAYRRNYCQTSVGNAERMVDMFAKDFRFVPVKGDPHWMVWDGIRWREDYGSGQVNTAAVQMTYAIKDEADQMLAAQPEGDDLKAARAHRKWFQTSQMAQGMNGTLSQFSKSPQVIASPESFDQVTGYLNLPNGMYNVDTGELVPHDRRMMFTNVFGTHFDPAATAPKFEQFMETVVPDPQMRKFLQRAIGYSLTGRPNQRALMILWGLKRTGKSQFVELMQALFGDYGYTAMAGTFHKVDKRGDAATPGQHSLKGKRFVSISETGEDAVLDETAIKRFTGTDSVSTRALYRKDENWKPQCVIWIVTNNKPLLSPDDTAVWDRVKLAHFPTQFSAKGGAGTLKETPDYASLLFAEEAPGILNWALAGLKEYQELGGLAEPEEIAVNAEAYRREVDPVSQFWDEQVELGVLKEAEEHRADAKALYRAYSLWCDENKQRAVGQRRFQARVRSRIGVAALPRSNSVTWVPGWQWTGLSWLGGHTWPSGEAT